MQPFFVGHCASSQRDARTWLERFRRCHCLCALMDLSDAAERRMHCHLNCHFTCEVVQQDSKQEMVTLSDFRSCSAMLRNCQLAKWSRSARAPIAAGPPCH
eukprot:4291896-Amphidinium_carterae.1